MLLVIPAIDLKNGVCCGIISGKAGTEKYYRYLSDHPIELSALLRKENAKSLHINDLDSFEGSSNINTVNSIIYLSKQIDIPVQVRANFNSIEECKILLDSGIYRVIINDLLCRDIDAVRKLIDMYSLSRIAFGIEVKNGKFYSAHYKKYIDYSKFLSKVVQAGGNRIVFGDFDWKIKPDSADLELLYNISQKYNLRVTCDGGVNSPQKLWEISEYSLKGIDSVIIGKPLYDNNFPCQEIWRFAESQLENL
jgi:phosphoribosylformimino-5-aminoimidazole carboxamide ribotide isomerase